jgi:hypothetical protein
VPQVRFLNLGHPVGRGENAPKNIPEACLYLRLMFHFRIDPSALSACQIKSEANW